MNKFFLIVLFLIFNIFFLSAQTFKTFLAKEGIETAVAMALSNGITTPKVMLVASTTEKSSTMPETLVPKIDLTTGQATVWLYRIVDVTDTSKSAIVGVVKVTLFGADQFVPNIIQTGSMKFQLPDITTGLPGLNWKNSDSMVICLNANEIFTTFNTSHTNTRIQSTIVGINTFNPMFPLDLPYWFSTITADNVTNPLICVTNAWTGETHCTNVNSIAEDNNGNKINVYPNPTQENLTLELPKNWNSGNLNISIYNYSGIEVLKSSFENSAQFLQLQLNFLPNGNYIIHLTDGINTLEQLFVINR